MRVWLDSWEWQCCGEPFEVGSEVEWALTPMLPEERSFLVEPLGSEILDGISHCETHHDHPHDEPRPIPTRGRVESIEAVYWTRAPRPGQDRHVVYPVEGSAVVVKRETVDGWEPEDEGGLRHEGYIVDLALIGSP